MSWYVRPDIERSEVDTVAVWRLLGDWTRDLPLKERHAATAALRQDVTAPVVLDLEDIKFIDSWGEEAVCDFIQRTHEEYGRAFWISDATRAAKYEGVRRALQRRKLSSREFVDRAQAVAVFRSSP